MKQYVCDRCNREIKLRHERQKVKLEYYTMHYQKDIAKFDLCDECGAQLVEWMNRKKV